MFSPGQRLRDVEELVLHLNPLTLGTGGAKIASAVATRIALTSTVAWILMLRLQKVVVCELTGKL